MPLLPFLYALIGLAVVCLLFLAWKPGATRAPGGKAFAFLLIFLVPSLAILGGSSAHLEQSKTTEFCLSCHAMKPYGRSLAVDDEEYLPAQHYQNNRVARDHACYTCHTNYVMFGDFKSKMRGLRHLWVNYFGSIPDTIRLYEPYDNRECLHCHLGSRSFERSAGHTGEDASLAAMKAGTVSCTESGCHDVAHDVGDLADADLYEPAIPKEAR